MEIGILASYVFGGVMVGSFTIAISDITGKKKYILVMTSILTIAQYSIFFISDYTARSISIFMFGFASAKFIVIYIHVLENLPKSMRA